VYVEEFGEVEVLLEGVCCFDWFGVVLIVYLFCLLFDYLVYVFELVV